MKTSYRLTSTRKKLMKMFSDKRRPLTAHKIMDLLTKESIEVNKTTVYRELAFLLKKGFIRELHISMEQRYYESTFLKHHHHLICERCGKIKDVTLSKDLQKEEKRLELEKGFKISSHSLEFFGLCADCR